MTGTARRDVGSEAELAADRRWILALARTLVHDPSAVDDVAQETWLARWRAQTRGLADGGDARPWVRRVLRNLAGNRRRETRRRTAREAAVARSEATASTLDAVACAEAQRLVLDAVLALREPYRETVLLRFWSDLPPRRIAALLDVPVETVRSRLRRATRELRGALDHEFGNRQAWCVVLAPLLVDRARGLAHAGFLGAVVMKKAQAVSVAIAAIAVALVLVGLLASLPRWSAGTGGAGDPTVAASAVDRREERGEFVAPVTEPDVPDAVEPRLDLVPETDEDQEDAAPASPDWYPVDGRVVVVDADGVESREVSGWFWSRSASDEFGAEGEVEVNRGRFHMRVPRTASVRVFRAELDGRLALPERPDLEIDGDGRTVLRLKWCVGATLRVLAAESSVELVDVTVCEGSPLATDRVRSGPGRIEAFRAEGLASPIALPEGVGPSLYVGAPGRIWTHARIDRHSGGETTVALAAGADLTVLVDGVVPAEAVFVRVHGVHETRTTHLIGGVVVENGRARLPGLRLGTYDVFVETGSRANGAVLGRRRVVLEAGTRTVRIRLDEKRQELVRVIGDVVFPAPPSSGFDLDWKRIPDAAGGVPDRPAIRVRSDEMTVSADGSRFGFDLGEIMPGRWLARVGCAWYHAVAVDVTPGSTLPVTIEIPELADVVVAAADAATGAIIRGVELQYGAADVEGLDGGSHGKRPDAKTGLFRFQVPVGTIELWPRHEEYLAEGGTFPIAPGRNDIRIEMTATPRVVVSLLDRGSIVAASELFWLQIQFHRDGRAVHLRGGRYQATGASFQADPGAYRIHFPPLEGYDAITPVSIRVPRAGTLEVRVPVTRRP